MYETKLHSRARFHNYLVLTNNRGSTEMKGGIASNLEIDTQAPSSYATSRNESEYQATSVMTSSNGLTVDSF